MAKEITLQGLAVSLYGSIAGLAQRLKWSYGKTYRIVKGIQSPNVEEMRALISALNLSDPHEIVSAFLLL